MSRALGIRESTRTRRTHAGPPARGNAPPSERRGPGTPGRTARPLTPEAEDALAARIRAGDESAREALILANLGLAVDLARRFRAVGMTVDDLIQEANLGLVRASVDFDPKAHGCRFSSYATHWIRKYIHRALAANCSLVRVPDYLYSLRKRLQRIESDARNLDESGAGDGRERPDTGTVLASLGIKPRWAEYLARAAIRPIASGGDIDGDRIPLEEFGAADPADLESERAEEIASVHAAIDRLTPFEAWVIRCRFGMADEHDLFRGARPSLPPGGARDDERVRGGNRVSSAPEDEPDGCMSYVWIGRACGLNDRRVRRVEYLAIQKLRAYLEP